MLTPYFGEIAHANFVGLPKQSSDAAIWAFAKRSSFDIITADKDFVELESMRGFPPKVIQLKFGNLDNASVVQRLIEAKEVIVQFLSSEEKGFLVLP